MSFEVRVGAPTFQIVRGNGSPYRIATGGPGLRGLPGGTGAAGLSAGLAMKFSTSTTIADPGPGLLRFDNATVSSVTAIAIDDQIASSGAPDASGLIANWQKGQLIIKKLGAPEVFRAFDVTSRTDNAGWTNLAVTYRADAGALANGDDITVEFAPTDTAGLAAEAAARAAADLLLAPLASPALTGNPTAPTQSAGDNSTKLATTAFVQAAFAALDALVYKGAINASANPNFPAADAGHTYKISVAGKIGGASGINVEAGDMLICNVDGTASGTAAAVGANWTVIQTNLDGAVIGPASAASGNFVFFDGTSGKLIKDLLVALSTDGTLASNSDAKIATEKAVKTYSDASGKLALYFGVNPYAAAGVALTGYYATRKAPYACTKTKLFAEVISSSAGGTITIYVDVNGSMVSGPHAVVLGTPLDLSGLAVSVPDGAQVSIVVTAMSNTVTEFFAQLYG